jgi:hypothetical protein
MGEIVPQIVVLPQPRQLNSHERAFLDFVLSAPITSAELREQAAEIRVVGECDCGCRSVALAPAPDAPSAAVVPHDHPRTDWIPLTAWGQSPAGTEIEVTVHVVDGRLHELEIWDGWASGGKSTGELPDLETLRHE